MNKINIINVENVYFTLKNQMILSDVNLSIQTGEVVVILGANGSGKSTILKTIAGIIKPTKGNILFKGKNLNQYSPLQYARQFSYVPQSQSLDADLNLLDYINLGRYPFTGMLPILSQIDHNKVQECINLFDLNHILQKKMNEISGGEQQRAHIARVLASNTELLILDEPTNSLDLKNQREFVKIIANLKNQNKTIIIALHSIDLATQIADKLILIKNGNIIYSDSPQNQNLEKLLSETFDTPITKRMHYDFELP